MPKVNRSERVEQVQATYRRGVIQSAAARQRGDRSGERAWAESADRALNWLANRR